MSLINQMDSTCIEKNTVSGIRLLGQAYQANLVSEPGSTAATLPQILGPVGWGPLFSPNKKLVYFGRLPSPFIESDQSYVHHNSILIKTYISKGTLSAGKNCS